MTDKQIKDYILGKSSPRDTAALCRWVAESDEHAGRLFRMEELYHAGRWHEPAEADIARAEDRLMERIAREEEVGRVVLRPRVWMRIAAAVAVVFVMAGVATYYVAQPDMIEVAALNGVRRVVLPDGSTVWLNRGARLTYPETFAASQRQVRLEGEAMFQVRHREAQPFTVAGGEVETHVLGTVFNVNTCAPRGREEVCLIEGKVAVSGGDSRMVLMPNQKMIYDKATDEMTVVHVNAPLEVVWHDNLIPFSNMNVREIADILERFYHIQITLSPTLNYRATYSGQIRRTASIDSVLYDLAYTMPFRYTRRGRSVTLAAR